MDNHQTVGDRANAMIDRHTYHPGIGFGRVVKCDLVWANVARLTIRKSDGTLVCPIKPTTI